MYVCRGIFYKHLVMRNLTLGLACILSVSISVTMSAQADINDFINAQVSGTSIYMEYSHQMMLDSIDAQNVLLGSVTAPVITSSDTGTNLDENIGTGQTVYTIVATSIWPDPTYAIAGADAALLGVDASTGVVTLTADPVFATKSSYNFTVTATDAAGNESNATTVTFAIIEVAGAACESPLMDGHSYAVVAIGDQCWFAENLRTTVYRDGAAIPEVTDNAAWPGLSTGARCDYDNDASNVATYGRLYNWYAATDASELCPMGWHVPTDGEWTALETYLGANGHLGTEATALMSTSGWIAAHNGTDEFEFSALPGGYRFDFIGSFANAGGGGYWWSSSPSGGSAWYRYLSIDYPDIDRASRNPRFGHSVRCLRDAD